MGEASELRVLRGDVIHGPFSRDQIRDLVARGRLSGSDLVSVRGGPWVRVSEYLGTVPPQPPAAVKQAPSPPLVEPLFTESVAEPILVEPTPPPARSVPRPPLNWPGILLWSYRALLAVGVVGVVCPWYMASSEVSGPFLERWGSQASVTGMSVGWGILSLLLLLGGEAASFLTRAWKVHLGLAAASFGLVGLAAIQLASAGPFGTNSASAFGGAIARSSAGLAWGIWLTLLASAAAAGAAYLTGTPALLSMVVGWFVARTATPSQSTERNMGTPKVSTSPPAQSGSSPALASFGLFRGVLSFCFFGLIVAGIAYLVSHSGDRFWSIGKSGQRSLEIARPGGVDPNDLASTSRYLDARLKEIMSLNRQNALAASKKLKEVQDELDGRLKEKVRWTLQVSSVTPALVWLTRPLPSIDISCRTPNADTENWGGIKLLIGEHISAERAMELRKGESIKLEGEIQSIAFEPLTWRQGVCIRLDNVHVTE